ncbi:chromosome segregation protein [Carpediemonas membranifera]|uniref:Chromosome segregation protein n=1 Tax=Carpediemonas membranifera TaxID=201153 RepID=A0A8J6E1L6_9EUKA|nr:chromosome segregation protein [Carpediemonas membranifera]|eukprot:KAG9393623.1 chromosome segregation protein [Carpediemonas membranifera]
MNSRHSATKRIAQNPKKRDDFVSKLEQKLQQTKDPKQRAVIAAKIAELTGQNVEPAPRSNPSSARGIQKPAAATSKPTTTAHPPLEVHRPGQEEPRAPAVDEWQVIYEAQNKKFLEEQEARKRAVRERQEQMRRDLDEQVKHKHNPAHAEPEGGIDENSVLSALGREDRLREEKHRTVKETAAHNAAEIEKRRQERLKAMEERIARESDELDRITAEFEDSQRQEREAKLERQRRLREAQLAEISTGVPHSPIVAHASRIAEGDEEQRLIAEEDSRMAAREAALKAMKQHKEQARQKDLDAVQTMVQQLDDEKHKFVEKVVEGPSVLGQLGSYHKSLNVETQSALEAQLKAHAEEKARAKREKEQELYRLEQEYVAFKADKERRMNSIKEKKLQYRRQLQDQIVSQQSDRREAQMGEIERKLNKRLIEDSLQVTGQQL